MMRVTQRELRELVAIGQAIDITYADSPKAIPEPYTQIGYAAGIYGCNGMLFKGNDTSTLYAITTRSQAIFIF